MRADAGRRVAAAFFGAALALWATAAAGAESFTKGPFLQALGPTGVTIKVEVSPEADAVVEVFAAGSTGSPVVTQKSQGAAGFHALRVEGLTPATAYDYRVVAAGTASETGHFTTGPGGDKPFQFVLYGDSRSDVEAHSSVVQMIEKAPADFLVNTGDMVERGGVMSQWKDFFAIEGKLLRDKCVFASVGNHELAGDTEGTHGFLPYFASFEGGHDMQRLYGSFRWGNTRFFLLNAMDDWRSQEREWLRGELDAAMNEAGLVHRFAVMHWGPFSSSRHGGNQALASGEVLGLMRDRKIELIMAGHDHAYERGEGMGLKYVISGGAGAPLYPQASRAPQTQAFESVHHFVEVAVDGEKVSLVVRRASGSVLESVGFKSGGGWETAGSEAKGSSSTGGIEKQGAPAGPNRVGACGCRAAGTGEAGGALGALAASAMLGAAARRRRREASRARLR